MKTENILPIIPVQCTTTVGNLVLHLDELRGRDIKSLPILLLSSLHCCCPIVLLDIGSHYQQAV